MFSRLNIYLRRGDIWLEIRNIPARTKIRRARPDGVFHYQKRAGRPGAPSLDGVERERKIDGDGSFFLFFFFYFLPFFYLHISIRDGIGLLRVEFHKDLAIVSMKRDFEFPNERCDFVDAGMVRIFRTYQQNKPETILFRRRERCFLIWYAVERIVSRGKFYRSLFERAFRASLLRNG